MLGAGNKGTPCRMSKGPRHCSGSSMHVTGGAHAGSPDKEASGIRLQAAAWDEVCTCGAERTATLLTVALPALWRTWRVVTPCADTASCVTSSNATALSACRAQAPRAVRGADSCALLTNAPGAYPKVSKCSPGTLLIPNDSKGLSFDWLHQCSPDGQGRLWHLEWRLLVQAQR